MLRLTIFDIIISRSSESVGLVGRYFWNSPDTKRLDLFHQALKEKDILSGEKGVTCDTARFIWCLKKFKVDARPEGRGGGTSLFLESHTTAVPRATLNARLRFGSCCLNDQVSSLFAPVHQAELVLQFKPRGD